MKEKDFTFVKLSTGGTLEVTAKTEKDARERHSLDPDLWELEKPPTPPSEGEADETPPGDPPT